MQIGSCWLCLLPIDRCYNKRLANKHSHIGNHTYMCCLLKHVSIRVSSHQDNDHHLYKSENKSPPISTATGGPGTDGPVCVLLGESESTSNSSKIRTGREEEVKFKPNDGMATEVTSLPRKAGNRLASSCALACDRLHRIDYCRSVVKGRIFCRMNWKRVACVCGVAVFAKCTWRTVSLIIIT